MTCRFTSSLVLLVATACGPTVDDPASDGSEDGGGGSEAFDCASVPANAVAARFVIGRGTPNIEILASDLGGDTLPLSCAEPLPRCNYELDHLTPIGDLAETMYTVSAGTLLHTGEYCRCCNGEDGGSDEAYGTFTEDTTHLVIEHVAEACIAGYYEVDSTRVDFVAARCDS